MLPENLSAAGAEKKRKTAKIAFAVCMAAYSLWLLYLLFFKDRAAKSCCPIVFGRDIKLIPFGTTSEFIDILATTDDSRAFWHGIRNLAGNIALFVPYGVFLPVFSEKCRRYGQAMLCSAACVIAIELAQLATRRGICDIDDLIFNLAGVSIGFALYKLWIKYTPRLRKEKV